MTSNTIVPLKLFNGEWSRANLSWCWVTNISEILMFSREWSLTERRALNERGEKVQQAPDRRLLSQSQLDLDLEPECLPLTDCIPWIFNRKKTEGGRGGGSPSQVRGLRLICQQT